jgi:hypothetical protein
MRSLAALHAHLKLLENQAELKRHLPTYTTPRSVREGLSDMARLVGMDPAALESPQALAALIGAPRFVMIWGTPSVTDHVARIIEGSRALLSVVVDPTHFEAASLRQATTAPGTFAAGGAAASAPGGQSQAGNEPGAPVPPWDLDPVAPPDSLKPLLSGKPKLTCRLFRAFFEHLLGFASPTGTPPGNALLVSEFCGTREHTRAFLATAMFILGAEVDRDALMGYMLQQGLFGLPMFQHMLYQRDYCDAFHAFRRLERAFTGSPAAEAALLRHRLDEFNGGFGGAACGTKLFEGEGCDQLTIETHLAAADLLEALALTPWGMSLNKAVAFDSCATTRSVATIAGHFEATARGRLTKLEANAAIADHLLAFARQFLADSPPA